MSKEILSRHWEELSRKANYLNIRLGTKFKDGKDTGVPALVVYVSKKVAAAELAAEHLIPKEIEGVATDVVELAPTTWQAGPTSVSQLYPELQVRRLGLKERPLPKARLGALKPKAPSGASEWTKYLSPIQDQGNCSSCVAFGIIGVWEGCIRIKENNPSDPIKLSEAHLFFCSGGTCLGGGDIVAALAQATQNNPPIATRGVCPESCLPYKDVDQGCGAGICADWPKNAATLTNWDTVSDPTQIKTLLDTKPLNATMSVHQSFFTYVSGVYKNLGPSDPIDGGHDIGCVGYSDKLHAYLIRNSWNTTWGQGCVVNGVVCPGYAWVDYAELDAQMYELIPNGGIVMATFVVQLKASDGGNVAGRTPVVVVNRPDGQQDSVSGTTDANGQVTLPYANSTPGNYSAQAQLAATSDGYPAASSPVVPFVISPPPKSMTITLTVS